MISIAHWPGGRSYPHYGEEGAGVIDQHIKNKEPPLLRTLSRKERKGTY